MEEQLLYTAATNFEAARHVSLLPTEHRSHRLHGHSFLATVYASSPLNWTPFPGIEVSELRQRLIECLKPLDYNLLNDKLLQPTDENLARWIRNNLGISGLANVGIQSTRDEGVNLGSNDHAHIWRRYSFNSAHQLPQVPTGHKCGRMHGHTFEVIIHSHHDLVAHEIGVDYDYLDILWAPIQQKLDHSCLNDIPGLENPTSELIASWIWQELKLKLPELSGVSVYETASCGAHFDGAQYRIWKEISLDSALRLERVPRDDPRRRIHGHTYTLRLYLSAPLDKVMGWTLDFGDVKTLFNPIFQQLDHHPLYELPDVEDNDIASLLRWIKKNANPDLPQLNRLDLYESRGCGAILSWDNAGPILPI